MNIKRRTLLRAGGIAVAATAPLPLVFRPGREPQSKLVPDAAGLLDLAPGLRYRIVERAFDPMTDGYRVAARPDGMAAFSENGTIVLMRNHELDSAQPLGPCRGAPPKEAYDKRVHGCVTRLVLDGRTLERISSNLVLSGTLRNCGGGSSPWGWLSCEEATDSGHGYVFLCRTTADRVEAPHRIASYGRFKHEAVCIDPKTHVAYLTEDQVDSCLYRFVPRDSRAPFAGQLQAMRVLGKPRLETATELSVGDSMAVDWVNIDNPDPNDDSVRTQAQERGAAIICRAEGAFFNDGAAYICSTSGGPAQAGQIFRLIPGGAKGRDRFELLAASTDPNVLDGPDNIAVAPWGDVLMAEDGGGDQYIRGLGRDGKFYDIARNANGRGEFAGVCCSPDGKHLFLNMQHDGLTVAISGDLASLGRA